jgi:hypothetical protein
MSEIRDKDIKLRVQKVKSGSKEEVVLEFVRSGDLMPMRQMLTWTMEMCWLPFAYEWSHADERAIAQKMALDAVYQLERHLDYIRDTFGLERSSKGENGTDVNRRDDDSLQASSLEIENELPGEYDLDALGFSDFDELSGEMFRNGSITKAA